MQEIVKDKLIERFNERVAFNKIERFLYSSDIGNLPKIITNLIHTLPDAVVQPEKSDDLVALIDLAVKNQIPLIPRGGASAGYGGAVPTKDGIVVDFSRMNKIIGIDKENKTVTVEPGITLYELDRELRKNGLSLRTYPGSAISATIGGWLANGGGIGIGSFEYGYLKDNIIELQLITPQGSNMIKGKNLDYVEGKAGTTGFITSLTLAVRENVIDIPVSAAFSTVEDMERAFAGIKEQNLKLWEVGYKNPQNVQWSIQAVENQAHKGPISKEERREPQLPDNKYIASFVYPESRKNKIEPELIKIVEAAGGEILSRELSDFEWSQKFYSMRLKALGPSVIPSEVVIPTDKLPLLINNINKRLKNVAFSGTLVAAGKETVVMGFLLEDERRTGYPLAFVNSFIPINEAEKLGGRVYTIGMLLANYAERTLGKNLLAEAYRFKRKVDPAGIMNPGKVFPPSIDAKSPAKWVLLVTKIGAMRLPAKAAKVIDTLFGGKRQGISSKFNSRLEKMPYGKELAWDAFACADCGYCRSGCTEFSALNWESASPRGKFKFLKENMKGNIEFDERMAEIIFACSTCGKCDNICQVRASIDGHWSVTARPLIWQKGFNPPAIIQGGAHNIMTSHNPGGFSQGDRTKWMTPDLKTTEEGEIGFFAGCNASFNAGLKNLPINAVRILNEAGIKPVYMGQEEWCCGGSMYNVGCWEDVLENVEHNIKEINRRQIKTLITSCAGCWANITHFYPVLAKRLGIPFETSIKHSSQTISELIDQKKLNFKFPIDLSVTYHDPCHIGHSGGMFEEPRKILAAIPSLKLIEMPNNREEAKCCGRFLLRYPKYGMGIQSKRLNEAITTGASALISTCPTCETNFRTGIKETGAELEVFDITDFVCQSNGIPTPAMSKFMKLGIM